MYRMAILSFLAPKDLDSNKCIQMSLIHDLAECIVGDLTPQDGVNKEEKAEREKEAIQKLIQMLNNSNFADVGSKFNEIYEEYTKQESKEAKFVKSLDLFDMYLQAYEYEKLNDGKNLEEFYESVECKQNSLPKQTQKWLSQVKQIKDKNYLPSDSNLNTILKDFLNNSNKKQ